MGVTLVVCLMLAQAPAEGPAILGVELRLPPGTDPALVAEMPELVPLRRGQRLSIRAVQRTIERLMGTGGFANVVVTAEEHEGGVELVILASPRLKVGQVFGEGNKALSTSELVAAAKMPTGSELSPETLADALDGVRAAYRRRGYLHAQIVAVPGPGELGYDIALQVQEGEPTRLENVVFAGEPGLSEVKLFQDLELELGEVVDQEKVEKGAERLRALLRKEHFYRARVEAPSLDENGRLTLPIHAGPQYLVRYRGNRSYPDAVLDAVYAYDGSETLDRTVLDRWAAKVAGFYRYRGFHDVDVVARESLRPDGRAALLIIDIEEGAPIRVHKVTFAGNSGISTSELEGVLTTVMKASAPVSTKLTDAFADALDMQGRVKNPKRFDMPQPPIESVLVDSAYRDAALSMRALYRDRGYLDAQVVLKPIELENRVAKVTFAVTEGRQVPFGDVKYEGVPDGFPLAERAWQPKGDPFSVRSLERIRQATVTELARRGYTFAKVESQWALDAQGAADVAFHLTLGPQVRVGKVFVHGLLRTDEAVVRSQLVVAEGKILNPDDLLDTQRNLISLGIFATAEVRLVSPETAEPVKDVLVELHEGKRLTGSWGLGYFLAEGPRAYVDGTYPNAFGEAVALQAHLQLNYFGASALAVTRAVDVSNLNQFTVFGGRANISLVKRGFLYPELGLRADLIAERVFRPSYQFTRVAASVPGIDWSHSFRTGFERLSRLKLTLLLQYEAEISNVLPVSSLTPEVDLTLPVADQQRLRFSFGTFALSTVRTGFTIDLRDDPVLPHAGGVLSGTLEPTTKFYAVNQDGAPVNVQFLKLQGQLTIYVPLGPAVVLALLARGGYIVPLASDSVTPPVKRFFVGGATSLRGFSEDGLLPEDVRRDLRGQVTACNALASSYGCTLAARTLLAGSLVPSQGGESFGVGKAELRFPFIGELNVGVFFELGNLWLAQPTSLTLRPVAGTGIRYLSPIGPLALDVGFNLQPDSIVNESPFQVHFNIGVF